MEEIMATLKSMGVDHPWMLNLLNIMVLSRIIMKPFSGYLLARFEKAVEYSIEEREMVVLDTILHNRWYRLAVFIIDWVFSIKLPKCVHTPAERAMASVAKVFDDAIANEAKANEPR